MSNIRELIKSIEAADSSFDEKLDAINKMEETLVAMRQQEEQAVQDNVDLIVEAIKVMENKVTAQLEVAKSIVPEKGDKGDKGDSGLDGRQGIDGKNGLDGRDGKDGIDGKDGVSVTDAKIDFDGSLIISLSTGQEINVGEVVGSDLQDKIRHITTMSTNSSDAGGIATIASADGSIVVTTTGSAVDLAVSQTSPASVLVEQVRNSTGATLTKGTAVYISGATGQLPTVSKALANADATSAQTLGLITSDLSNNSNGYVTIIGLVTNIDTSAYTDGAQLYLSPTTAGTLTTTKPYAPQHLVYMAVVAHAHPTHGKLIVKVQNGYEMDELHNVSAQSPTTGQTLVYNSSTSLWEKNTVSLTAGVNGTLPIANGGTNATTAAGALTSLGAYASSNPSGYTNNTGTVTSVAATVPSFLSVAGSPITTSGTLAITLSGTALPIANGGTGATTLAGASIATYTGTETLTNKRIDPRVTSAASASSLTPSVATADVYAYTALAAGLTINAPTGTPVDGDKLMFRLLDNGTGQTLTWNATYTVIGVTLPTTTTANKTTYVGCIYNANNTRWDVIAVTTQA